MQAIFGMGRRWFMSEPYVVGGGDQRVRLIVMYKIIYVKQEVREPGVRHGTVRQIKFGGDVFLSSSDLFIRERGWPNGVRSVWHLPRACMYHVWGTCAGEITLV